ncbi:MAG: ABC transporter substrate-binding protein [Spirochaetales bacterium]|uniref:ABC transporter substrate-binding protein n=1 Tax=Candidatus Thalassospirochaeta sargassi TaxID=3119039 RepID=A0AAJ1ID83_9SPIO|nr:ABC transporter substrate-binding protein [Spirochaetales bacterium]
MKKILTLLMIMLLTVSFAFAGGQQESAGSTDAAVGGSEVVVDEWEIPFLNCLTGAIASIGEYLQWGAEYAAEQINAEGGIAGKPVKIVRVDTALSPEKGTVEMSKLVDDALVVMGPVPEPVIMAAVPIAADEGLYSFTATTSYEYAAEYFPWAISWFSPTDEKLPPIVTAWAEKVEAKNVVQFVENYGAWPGMAKAHVIGLEDAGVNVLEDVEVPSDAVSFGPLIVKALAQDPDAIVFACNAEKAAKIIIELRNRGWEDMNKMLVFSSADDAALYTTGGEKIDGVMIYNYNDPALDTPRWNDFRQAFKDDHDGIEPFSLSPNYYDAVYMIKRAIEDTGITGDPKKLAEERIKIRDYCNDIQNFEGLQYNWTNKGGYPADKPLFLFEIQDGQKVLVEKIIPE